MLRSYKVYYRVITTVERDTWKYHEFIAGIVYECAARVNNTGGSERVMFPRYRVHTVVMNTMGAIRSAWKFIVYINFDVLNDIDNL